MKKSKNRFSKTLGNYYSNRHVWNNSKGIGTCFTAHWRQIGILLVKYGIQGTVDRQMIVENYYKDSRAILLKKLAVKKLDSKLNKSWFFRNEIKDQQFYLYALRLWKLAALKVAKEGDE